MKSMKLGSPKLGKSLSVEGQDFLFPLLVEIENITPRRFISNEAGISVSAREKQTVEFKNSDQLIRAITDMESIAALNGYEHAATLRFQQSETEETAKKHDPEPEPAEEEAEGDADESGDDGDVKTPRKSRRGRPPKSVANKTGDDA